MKDKRILAFLLALVMCLSLLPVTAFADDEIAEAPEEEAAEEETVILEDEAPVDDEDVIVIGGDEESVTDDASANTLCSR